VIYPELHPDDIPMIADEVRDLPNVRSYLATVNEHAPSLDLTYDRAVVIGVLAAAEIRAGRWDEHRAMLCKVFTGDDVDVLALAAVSLLVPGPVPEPFATVLGAAQAAQEAGLGAEEAAALIAEKGR
jgi:hypothetical protein